MARVRTLYPSNARPKVRPRRRRVGSLARLQRQEPVGPHRELRCPPGTYFSPRSLRSNLSDLEENAVLDHKVRPRHRAQPRPRRLPTCRGRTIGLADCIPGISPQPLRCVLVSHRRPAVLQRQDSAGPHRELRCPPGTYFSSRSLRSNPSDLEENAVPDHKVRPRHRAQPRPRHLPTSRGRTPLERGKQQARHAEDTPPGPRTAPPGAALSPYGASSRFSQPGPPPAHPCVRQGRHPRICQALSVRPRRSTGPGSTGNLPSRSQESPSQQPRTPKNPVSLEERRADIGQHPQAH
mgnify:CR=1 FL=1